jgi:peptidyl-prolyl cis-trans isomerase C
MATYSHILVNHNYEAEDILRLLNQGKDFADLARRFSKCSSAVVGGYLGALPPGRTHPEFEEAFLILKPQQHTLKPVRTPVGYHIIFRQD